MKLGVIAETADEKAALESGRVPVPLIETWYGLMLARTVMVAAKLGVFGALESDRKTATDLAEQLGTSAPATLKLLRALVGAGYLAQTGDEFELTAMSRRWLMPKEASSFHNKLMFQFVEWDWWSGCEAFVKTGQPLSMHNTMTEAQWALYQRGMRAGKDAVAQELAQRLPVPPHARTLWDVGGAHGLYSVALCRTHQQLKAQILDLPQAVEHAAVLLAREGLGERITYRPSNVLEADLGQNQCDVILVASLMHHFDEPTNEKLVARLAQALRPGGLLAIMEVALQQDGHIGQLGGLLDLNFAMTSQSGSWSTEEIERWARQAQLKPLAPIALRTAPNVKIHPALKASET